MSPRERVVDAPALSGGAERIVPGNEPVEPVVPELAVVSDVARVVEVALTRVAAPVERGLRVHVVGDGEVVTEPFDVAAVRLAVSDEVAGAEVRRDHAAVTAVADVLKEKGQPQHGAVAVVRDPRARHEKEA